MLRRVTLLALAGLGALLLLVRSEEPADTPTFARDVAPIVYRRCASCHHEGSSGPFPLLTHADVSKRARQLRIVLAERIMPPWPPVAGHGDFHEPRSLTDAELATFLAWIDGGTPLGDADDLPPVPTFADGWKLGKPDIVLSMDEPYEVPAEGFDVWRTFVVPTGLERTTNLRAIEFRPGNERVVHHFIMYMDRSGNARAMDVEDPGVGYPGMTAEAELLGDEAYGWVPGMSPHELPPGVATRVAAGTDFVLDTHFVPTGRVEPVRMEIGLFLAKESATAHPAGVILIGPGASIPPGVSAYTIGESFVLPVDAKAMTIAPHAHYVCKRVEVWAERPDGRREDLLRIDDWDPNWQEVYRYRELVPLPQGTRLEMRFTYDNSSANPRNPFEPPHRVITGKASYNEMAIAWINVIVDDEQDLALLREVCNEKYRADSKRATTLIDIWKSVVQRFDADASGTLDPEEDAAATAYVEAIWDNVPLLMAGFDQDDDGVLDDEEREYVEMVVRCWKGAPVE